MSIFKGKSYFSFIYIAPLLILSSAQLLNAQEIFIRFNQLGYLPQERKKAVIFSDEDISNSIFNVKNSVTNEIILQDTLTNFLGEYGNYPFNFEIDFTKIDKPGQYYIESSGTKSTNFYIETNIYNHLVDSLLAFFRIQRCGFNKSDLHEFCHYYDATSYIVNDEEYFTKIDATGGWHDAGDYIKFLNTTAYATYILLFSYEFDGSKFDFDNNQNYFPDILEEALIGLDWLIKANYDNKLLVTQIQDLNDQRQGWRLPEDDNLLYNRPAFLGIGKNLIGIYSATMALAYRVLKEFNEYEDYSNKCLTLAENFYSLKDSAPDVNTSATGHYQDTKYHGKLALASIELYESTKRNIFLNEAKAYAEAAGSDYWWSWGDINSLSHYRISKYEPEYKKYILNNLNHFKELSNSNIFSEAITDTWGSNSANLGVALTSLLWYDLTSDSSYMNLVLDQRDFILGTNPWGISFIYNIGEESTKNFHSQVAYFNNGKLTGAVSAGPISRKSFNEYNIELEHSFDRLEAFQTDKSVYFDDRMDYVTNEPTITANATAIFVFGYFSLR